jgi:hypothetical protein
MKQIISYFITCLLFSFVLVGCAQWGGDNPVGITGGGDDGYGQNSALNLPQPSDGTTNDLVGSWRYNVNQSTYMIWTFSINGNLTATYYYNDNYYSSYGTYSTSGNSITYTLQQQTSTGTYTIRGNHLTITINGESTTFTRLALN